MIEIVQGGKGTSSFGEFIEQS